VSWCSIANAHRLVERAGSPLADKAVAAFTKIGKKYDILHKTKEEIIAKYGK